MISISLSAFIIVYVDHFIYIRVVLNTAEILLAGRKNNMKRVFSEINIFKNILDMFTFPKN
jgi:hypothetical protein